MDREKRTLQYRSFNLGPSTCKVEKCVNFAIANGLSKNCPRKYWLTDQSPNRTRTFSDFRIFRTPIYTSNSYRIKTNSLNELRLRATQGCPTRFFMRRVAFRHDASWRNFDNMVFCEVLCILQQRED